jgi:hypothetical protein
MNSKSVHQGNNQRNFWLLANRKSVRNFVTSKLEIISWATFSTKFLIERAPSWTIFDFWDFGQIGTGAEDHLFQAQNNLCAESFSMSLFMFNSGSRNSSFAQKIIFIREDSGKDPGLVCLGSQIPKFQTTL